MPAKTRKYEAMVIIKSILPEETITGTIEKLGALLTNGGATITETARWGRRRLAYEIKKQAEGFYVIFYFTLEGNKEVLAAFERACRYDENVLRHMFVTIPARKRGEPIKQVVPSPGWLSEYRFEPRPMAPRRPRPPRDGDMAPAPAVVAAAPAEVSAPAAEEAAPAADAPQA